MKVGLGERARHEFEHFVERHAEDGDDLLGVGEHAPLMHRDARLYTAQLLAALSLERGACDRLGYVASARRSGKRTLARVWAAAASALV